MRGFPNGAECRDQHGPDSDKHGAYERVLGEPFTQNQSSKDRIKDEAGLLKILVTAQGFDEGRLTAWRVERTGSGRVVI